MKRLLLTCLLLCLPLLAFAQPVVGYGEGEIGFTYAQWPVGSYAGTFHAQGPVGGAGGFLDPDQDEGCGGAWGPTSDGMALVAYGAVRNPDDTMDVVVVFIQSDTEPPAAGNTYDVGFSDPVCLFGFVDDAAGIELPEDPQSADWADIIQSVEAAHKFLSTSGGVTISALDGEQVQLAFGGTMADVQDPNLVVTVSGANCHLSGGFVPTERLDLSRLKLLYR